MNKEALAYTLSYTVYCQKHINCTGFTSVNLEIKFSAVYKRDGTTGGQDHGESSLIRLDIVSKAGLNVVPVEI